MSTSVQEEDRLQIFDCLEEALRAVDEYEERTASRFLILERQKSFGNEEVFSSSCKLTVYWEGPVVSDVILQEYTGAPYIIAGRKVLGCHVGKDRALSQKKKYTEVLIQNQITDQTSGNLRKSLHNTKKVNCPAKIYIYHSVTFPDFQIGERSDWLMGVASRRLQMALEKNPTSRHRYHVIFPGLFHHEHHPVDGGTENSFQDGDRLQTLDSLQEDPISDHHYGVISPGLSHHENQPVKTEVENSFQDGDRLQTFDSLQEAMRAIDEYEERTASRFVVLEKQKRFGNEECFVSISKVRVHWEGPVAGDFCLREYSGVPFIIVGRKVLGCHLGKDLALSQKRRYAEVLIQKQITDQTPGNYRKSLHNTKKVDCPSKIFIYHTVTFPEFQIKERTAWQTRNASRRIRAALEKNVAFHHRYDVIFPGPFSHENHPVEGEAAHVREKIDPRVMEKIQELFRSGVHTKRDIEQLLRHFVCHELFLGREPPDNSRRRFFPSRKDIENIMRRCAVVESRSRGGEDQGEEPTHYEQLEVEIPEHVLYCDPCDQDGNMAESFTLHYRTDHQETGA